jgi:hypothetical protein
MVLSKSQTTKTITDIVGVIGITMKYEDVIRH